MIKISEGNLNQLQYLFDRYHLKIYRFFQKMVQNQVVSEDLTQDVFVKVIRYRSSYKHENFASWIFTIARNIFSTHYQKQKKERSHIINDDLTDSGEVLITDSNTEELNHLQKALRAIYSGGVDNADGFGFSINKEGNILTAIDLKPYFQRDKITFTLPKTINIDIRTGSLAAVQLDGFSSEVEVKTNIGEIDLKNVTGPITAHSRVGNISVDFSKVNQISPTTISNSVGDIDVTLPSSTKANLNLKTNGDIYTNFDFKIETKKELKNARSRLKKMNQEINGGGVSIKLSSSIGNIYLRKK